MHYLPLDLMITYFGNYKDKYKDVIQILMKKLSGMECGSIAHMDIAREDKRRWYRHLDETQWDIFIGRQSPLPFGRSLFCEEQG